MALGDNVEWWNMGEMAKPNYAPTLPCSLVSNPSLYEPDIK